MKSIKTSYIYITRSDLVAAVAVMAITALMLVGCQSYAEPTDVVESPIVEQSSPTSQPEASSENGDPDTHSDEETHAVGTESAEGNGYDDTGSGESRPQVQTAPETPSAEPVATNQIEIQVIPQLELPDAVPEDVAIIWEAFQFINDEYVDFSKLDSKAMSEAAIKAFIETIDDPHMGYIPPERYELDRSDLEGSFEGIGASVQSAPDGNGVVIVAPLPNTPALRAGIKAGDRILKVDGEDATGWTVTEAVLKIRGPRGEPVTLTVLHVGATEPVDITIIRDRVEQESVRSRMIPDTPYGELNIDLFTDDTPKEIREHMDKLLIANAEGIVIDLRNNPGGLLQATLDAASEFISEGKLAYEEDRDGKRRDFYARGDGSFTRVPIVLLVNEWSGSGAELFAGALQDHGRAVLIGTKTFGKGSVNITKRLSNGGGLSITIRRWFTPNGNAIEGVGLEPDVKVEYPENVSERDIDFTDPQLDAAIKQLDFQTRVTTSR